MEGLDFARNMQFIYGNRTDGEVGGKKEWWQLMEVFQLLLFSW